MVGKNWETKENTKQRCHGVISSKRLSELTDIILFKQALVQISAGGDMVLQIQNLEHHTTQTKS